MNPHDSVMDSWKQQQPRRRPLQSEEGPSLRKGGSSFVLSNSCRSRGGSHRDVGLIGQQRPHQQQQQHSDGQKKQKKVGMVFQQTPSLSRPKPRTPKQLGCHPGTLGFSFLQSIGTGVENDEENAGHGGSSRKQPRRIVGSVNSSFKGFKPPSRRHDSDEDEGIGSLKHKTQHLSPDRQHHHHHHQETVEFQPSTGRVGGASEVSRRDQKPKIYTPPSNPEIAQAGLSQSPPLPVWHPSNGHRSTPLVPPQKKLSPITPTQPLLPPTRRQSPPPPPPNNGGLDDDDDGSMNPLPHHHPRHPSSFLFRRQPSEGSLSTLGSSLTRGSLPHSITHPRRNHNRQQQQQQQQGMMVRDDASIASRKSYASYASSACTSVSAATLELQRINLGTNDNAAANYLPASYHPSYHQRRGPNGGGGMVNPNSQFQSKLFDDSSESAIGSSSMITTAMQEEAEELEEEGPLSEDDLMISNNGNSLHRRGYS